MFVSPGAPFFFLQPHFLEHFPVTFVEECQCYSQSTRKGRARGQTPKIRSISGRNSKMAAAGRSRRVNFRISLALTAELRNIIILPLLSEEFRFDGKK